MSIQTAIVSVFLNASVKPVKSETSANIANCSSLGSGPHPPPPDTGTVSFEVKEQELPEKLRVLKGAVNSFCGVWRELRVEESSEADVLREELGPELEAVVTALSDAHPPSLRFAIDNIAPPVQLVDPSSAGEGHKSRKKQTPKIVRRLEGIWKVGEEPPMGVDEVVRLESPQQSREEREDGALGRLARGHRWLAEEAEQSGRMVVWTACYGGAGVYACCDEDEGDWLVQAERTRGLFEGTLPGDSGCWQLNLRQKGKEYEYWKKGYLRQNAGPRLKLANLFRAVGVHFVLDPFWSVARLAEGRTTAEFLEILGSLLNNRAAAISRFMRIWQSLRGGCCCCTRFALGDLQ
ncbi:hypothetical protein R3P38DRAFT_2759644 [Favolaschia claudopus]|uniref:Uncharacterized protein n=1 Tax=Favolaschia claudopus TaxID=2862362 RepID=A0AAW0E0P2_9AGAR